MSLSLSLSLRLTPNPNPNRDPDPNPNPNPGPDPNPNQGLKTKLSDKSAELAAAEGELAKLRQQLDEVQRREERTKEMLRATQVSPTP